MKVNLLISESITQLEQMAEQLGIKPKDNRIEIPSVLGEGFCQFYPLPYNIQLHHYVYCLHRQIEVKSHNDKESGMFIVNINLSNGLLDKNVGSSQYWLNKEGKHGVLFYSPGNDSRGINEIDQSFEVVFFSIPKAALSQCLKSLGIKIDNIDDPFCKYVEIEEQLANELIRALRNDSPKNLFITQGLLLRLLGDLLERFYSEDHQLNNSGLKMRDVELQLKAKEILQTHIFGVAPTIEELASMLNISKSKLKSDFKLLFGNSVYQYYLEKKMKTAYTLLKENQGTVAEIGYRLGYSNISQFSSQFKKQFGIPPSQVN